MKAGLVISLVLTLLLLTFITGCGQQGTNNPTGVTGGIGEIEDNPGGGSNSLIGTWYGEDIDYENEFKSENYLTFNSDNSYYLESILYEMDDGYWILIEDYSESGSYQVNGNQLTINNDNGDTFNLTYSIQGDSLTIYNEEGEALMFTRYYGKRDVKPSFNENDDSMSFNKSAMSFFKHFSK